MQVDLRAVHLPVAMLPLRFGWEAWREDRTPAHAAILYEGFRDGIDAAYMPALRSAGLMRRFAASVCRGKSAGGEFAADPAVSPRVAHHDVSSH